MKCVVVGINVSRRLVKLIVNDKNTIRPFWECADKVLHGDGYQIDAVVDSVYCVMRNVGWV
jgi:hypothetical protein